MSHTKFYQHLCRSEAESQKDNHFSPSAPHHHQDRDTDGKRKSLALQ
jgi:hypothetical protein